MKRVWRICIPFSPALRILFVALAYSAILSSCLWLSVQLRFDFDVASGYWLLFRTTLLWLLPLKLLLLLVYGQFRSLLTYFSLSDAKGLIQAMVVATLIAMLMWYADKGQRVVPRAVILTDFLLSVGALAAMRTGMRICRERYFESSKSINFRRRRVAIIGAGSAGSALFREIHAKAGLGMDVVCFFDDNREKIGSSLHGRKIVGARADLPVLVESLQISRAIIAMPGASPSVIRETVGILNTAGIEHDILPSVSQILHKQVSVSHLRHVDPEDLLGRKPVALDETGISELIRGKTVMVTGAGGSIGSELCRQVAFHCPAELVLVDRSEPSLFQIEQELRVLAPDLSIEALASSVTQQQRMADIFRRFRPAIVFHAAAHKHVPLMESQPIEAIFNNSYGTVVVAKLAAENRAEKFVLVSTDKAVNPTNVMGATKRLAELVIAELQHQKSGTSFSSVRFGNVLGSSGSVIPIFRSQISAGGPVRITHPDITRFFMSIPEAAGLVLQSAWQSRGGEVFVLDMGEPVKIVDLARQMIELSGLEPDKDIKIEFTGLRPGEKLFEEPIHKNENINSTAHAKILMLRNVESSLEEKIIDDLLKLVSDSACWETEGLKDWLSSKIPEYKIWKN